jgi:hypothetical protein
VNTHDPRLAALIERAERFGQRVEAERNQIARLRYGLAAVFGGGSSRSYPAPEPVWE